jgi:hypothetical protein
LGWGGAALGYAWLWGGVGGGGQRRGCGGSGQVPFLLAERAR